MTFIPENYITESLSMCIDDYILPIGGLYKSYTELYPDNITAGISGVYKLKNRPFIFDYKNDSSDAEYISILKRRFLGIGPMNSFNENTVNNEISLLSPNDTTLFDPDYTTGSIKAMSASLPIKAVYNYKFVNVITGWQDNPELIKLPTVSINSGVMTNEEWAIGTEDRINRYTYHIDVWAASLFQRSLIVSLLQRALKIDIPLYDFSKGYPLLNNGKINQLFNSETQRVSWMKIEKSSFVMLQNNSGTTSIEKARATGVLTISIIN